MDGTCNHLDRIRKIVDATLGWLSGLPAAPVAYIAEDRTPVATGVRPLLEFGVHSRGGPAELRVGGFRAESRPGTLAVVNAHFRNFGTPRTHWGFWCLSFDVRHGGPVPGIGAAPLLLTAALADPGRVQRRYEALAREFNTPGPAREARVQGAALLLLAELLEGLPGAAPGPQVRSLAVRQAMEWMRAHCRDSGLTLQRVADEVHLSAAHLGRLFRAETGSAPMKYLREVRMARARQLLHRTGLGIAEIAREVGYADPAYFSRLFKSENNGLSPRRFRLRNHAPAAGSGEGFPHDDAPSLW